MQVIVQVLTSAKRSLRDAIVRDTKLKKFGLKVSEQKRISRSPGWAKLHSCAKPKRHGAINIQWIDQMLLCRIITKGRGKPNKIIADFVDYLLARFQKSIRAINILPK